MMYREILMDLSDVDGDRGMGVWTIPVILGRGLAFAIGLAFVTAAACLAASRACVGINLGKLVRH